MPEQPLHRPLGKPLIQLETVDSTNNYALALLHEGMAHHGMAILAQEQLAGKGQRGKNWTARKGDGLLLSVVINPYPLLPIQQFQLSACVAVAAHAFYAKYAGSGTRIKWPNDIYWQDRKAGGILIENIIGQQEVVTNSSSWKWAVAGIGLNLNQPHFPEDMNRAVSLLQITGREQNPIALATELCEVLSDRLDELLTKGFEAIYQYYLAYLYKKNEKVRLKKGSRVFEAVIKAVTPSGQLLVETGMEEFFNWGEVEWGVNTSS